MKSKNGPGMELTGKALYLIPLRKTDWFFANLVNLNISCILDKNMKLLLNIFSVTVHYLMGLWLGKSYLIKHQ